MSGGGNTAYGRKSFKRSKATSRTGSPRTAATAGRWRPAATGWWSAAPVRGRAGRWSPGGCSAWRTRCPSAVADPLQDDRSWRFTLDPDGRDPVLGIRFLSEAYDRRETGYPGGVSVPAIVDVPSGGLVTNDYQQITLDLATEWTALHRAGAPDLYPEPLRDEIDEVTGGRLRGRQQRCVPGGLRHRPGGVRGGVRAASSGGWSCWPSDWRGQRYLVGDTITEADIRLFTTLVRFDAVYHGHFKCNRWKLTEHPVLWAYARDLSRRPVSVTPSTSTTSSGTTTRCTPASTRPASCPSGPDLAGWLTPHHREELGGRPFGDGTPPGPGSGGRAGAGAGRP